MVRTISKIAVAALCLLALAVFTPQAKASGADFGCTGSACTGNVGIVGTVYSSTSIGTTAGPGFSLPGFDTDEGGEAFNVSFSADTATGNGTITITDTTDADATLTGIITNFSVSSNSSAAALSFDVVWSMPPGYGTVGGHVGISLSSNSSVCGSRGNNCVASVDILVTPTPEPASLLLLGTGLLGLGGMARRRWLN